MDFIEGLLLSEGYDTILVIVCRLSKMALFITTHRDIDAEDLAMLFLVHVFSKLVLGKFGLVWSGAIFAGPETGQSGP